MEKKPLLLCFVVGSLGLLSAATGFGAEATRIKGSEVQFVSATQCSYPRSPALALGLTAAVALMTAQIIINIATGCICCRRGPNPSNSNWRLALVHICYILSSLANGAALNDQHGEESMYFGNYYCYVVKPGVFAGGAILALASVTLGILYYLTINSAKASNGLWGNSSIPNQGAIAMGQPQFPPQAPQDPVFVHEDTYIRRQFT